MKAQRTTDFVIAGLGLAGLSPILLGIALCVWLFSGRPVFYVARRVGLNGRVFGLYKFRTMEPEAHSVGPAITLRADPRVTPVGRVLRRYKLDELPQLANVLKGDMSLVGPRPEDPKYVALYAPSQRRALELRPGITSPASLRYRKEEALLGGPDWEKRYLNEIMGEKLQMEIEYANRRSLRSDLLVMLQTVAELFLDSRPGRREADAD